MPRSKILLNRNTGYLEASVKVGFLNKLNRRPEKPTFVVCFSSYLAKTDLKSTKIANLKGVSEDLSLSEVKLIKLRIQK